MAPLLKAAREYEWAFTVCVEAEQFAHAAWVATQDADDPPFCHGQVQETEFPAEGNVGEAGADTAPDGQNASEPKEDTEKA